MTITAALAAGSLLLAVLLAARYVNKEINRLISDFS
jgi:hypothetical protein